MLPLFSVSARRLALAIALVALASVVAQFLHLNARRAEPAWITAWDMARYFTILTNLMVAVSFVILSRSLRRKVPYAGLAALTLSMIMVGVIYHLLLADLVDYTGLGWWADHGLHTVGPIAITLWWLRFAAQRVLSFAALPVFALWPAAYGVYVLVRGALDGVYPYPFVDLTVQPPGIVAMNLAVLLASFLLGGVGMIAIARFANR